MIIKNRQSYEISENDVTDEEVYFNRRRFIKTGIALGGSLLLPAGVSQAAAKELKYGKSALSKKLKPTDERFATRYNNFYEFGTGKGDPAQNAHTLKTDPWSITVEGHVEKPGTLSLEDVLKKVSLEERIYRLRCVEAWSMVIPWVGFTLSSLLKQFKPTSKAKYVEFVTLHDPKQMPGQRRPVLRWPYTEGLRIDEAMHPLTILATGMYGKTIPKQNGAPIRLVVPWKYGFKYSKSIVKIRLVEKLPLTSWVAALPNEYGFYANVNPEVDHPRWTQKRERIIGTFRRRRTDMFNGFADQVASLYQGMDLRKFY